MQKKALALAVAGVLGAPAVAMAQTSTVQIFGTLYIEYSYAHQGPGGAAAVAPTPAGISDRQNVDFLQNPGSELGFKGEEKLGGGLSAWFQCASTMDFRAGTTGGDGVLCSRNSGLGMKGGFGNIWIGRWDLPFKRTISPTNVSGNDTGIFGTAFLLTGGSTSTFPTTARATFKRREGNTIFYDSPDFAGFQVMASVSAANGTPAAGAVAGPIGTAGTTGVTARKPRTLSIGGQYSAGPLYISTGYERHNQAGGNGLPAGTGSQEDHGWHVGATYAWGPVRFGGQFTSQRFQTGGLGTGALGTDAKYDAWHVGADWTIAGPHGLRVAYTQAKDAKGTATNLGTPLAGTGGVIATTNTLLAGTYRPAPCLGLGPTAAAAAAAVSCNNTGAKMYQIRYVYTFSKRTEFNLGYVRLDNESRAAYALGGLSAPQIGTDQWAWAFSLRHTF